MKKTSLAVFATAMSLIFSSCSSEETMLPQEQNSKILKTYKVKRDATGAYSVDFNLSENAIVDKVVDTKTNLKEFSLYSTNNQTERNYDENLSINNSQLRIGFVDNNVNKKQYISITDDITSFNKKSTDIALLDSYSITSNEDGTFGLDFSVKSNSNVSFVYNEEIKTYEVHLESGANAAANYTRTLEKEEGEVLKIDFVNHIANVSGKGSEAGAIRKPVIIIDSD
ncbi:MAG: hypothetical protein WAO74_07630 [Polaribacter sp.]|uniref:hypothetical protein n=1 Tax=Polaribacter sp. TaxID=1920175 RepID=UPI003BB07179